jgi:hypothetical protein
VAEDAFPQSSLVDGLGVVVERFVLELFVVVTKRTLLF